MNSLSSGFSRAVDIRVAKFLLSVMDCPITLQSSYTKVTEPIQAASDLDPQIPVGLVDLQMPHIECLSPGSPATC